MTLRTAEIVLAKSAAIGISGVVWTGGGEPTTCKQLPQMLQSAAGQGMVNALYTNAIQLGVHPHLAMEILAPENAIAFVRPSLNFIRPETARSFAGATPEDIDAQYRGLAALFCARDELLAVYRGIHHHLPAIQVSVICDERNVGELPLICERVAAISSSYEFHGPHDDLIVRPLTKHCRACYSTQDHDEAVITEILAACGANGSARSRVEDAGMNLHLGFGIDRIDRGEVASYEDVLQEEYDCRDVCWANGLFLTVGPNAKVYLCTDRNCYDEWVVIRADYGDRQYHSGWELSGGSARRMVHEDRRQRSPACGHAGTTGSRCVLPQ